MQSVMLFSGLFNVILLMLVKMTIQRNICKDELKHINCKLLPKDGECGQGSQIGQRILKGSNAAPGEFPWMVQLLIYSRKYWDLTCGGTLINSRYAVTAAHCYAGKKLYKVVVGSHTTDGGKELEVEVFIIHEHYNKPKKQNENDIALVRLKKPVKISRNVSPICLPISDTFQSGKYEKLPFEAIGFGISKQTNRKDHYPDILQKVSLTLLRHSSCKKTYYDNDRSIIGPQQFCTGHKNGRDTCNGDSGGPLMTQFKNRYYLTGIISFGDEVCGKGLPNVHVKVVSYLTWILDNMEP